MVDFFLLLMLPGAGDELQGIKRGIMEMADALLINKADGDQKDLAMQAKAQYQHALHLFPPAESGWTPVVKTCSAQNGTGIAEVWDLVSSYALQSKESGWFDRKRLDQTRARMHQALAESIWQRFFAHDTVTKMLPLLEQQLAENKLSPYIAAQKLLEAYHAAKKS
jgi:LAO/AO transport system kinase